MLLPIFVETHLVLVRGRVRKITIGIGNEVRDSTVQLSQMVRASLFVGFLALLSNYRFAMLP